MKKELSVIIPAYNEEDRIADTLREVAAHLSFCGYRFEILVVNDGSKDSTRQVTRDLGMSIPSIRLIDQPRNCGKGEAVKRGVREARYPISLFMDADNSTRIAEWDKFESFFESGARVVIASRHLPDSRIVHPQPFLRRFLGSGYRALSRLFFGLKLSDFNCGFKAYETPVAKKIYESVRMNDWTFDVEVFCLLKKEGVAFVEVPVRWEHHDKKGGIAPFRTAFRTLGSLFRLKAKGY